MHSLGNSTSSNTGGGSTTSRGRARSSSTSASSKTTADSTSTSRASSTHLSSTGAGGRGRLLGLSDTVEATSIATSLGLVLLVVDVHSPGQTLLSRAHGVSTVDTGGSVGQDSVHDTSLAAEVAEGSSDLLVGDIGVGDTLEGVVHALAEVSVRRRGQLASGVPVRADGGTATADSGGDAVFGRLHAGRGDRGHLLGEVAEVGEGADAVAGGGDETVFVGFLVVHVDDTAGPDIGHLVTVQDGNIGELAGTDFVATVLGEEGGDRVVCEFLGALLVAGCLEGGVTAPLVDVVTEEVDGVGGFVADQVVGDGFADGGIVIGGVTDGEGATVILLLDVGLHVADGGLDVCHRVGVVDLVGDFVSGEEADDVGVLGEGIDDLGVASEEIRVPGRVVRYDGFAGRGQIGDEVDTGIGEGGHTLIVVLAGVDGVGTDNVGAQLGQVGNIALAAVDGERVGV